MLSWGEIPTSELRRSVAEDGSICACESTFVHWQHGSIKALADPYAHWVSEHRRQGWEASIDGVVMTEPDPGEQDAEAQLELPPA